MLLIHFLHLAKWLVISLSCPFTIIVGEMFLSIFLVIVNCRGAGYKLNVVQKENKKQFEINQRFHSISLDLKINWLWSLGWQNKKWWLSWLNKNFPKRTGIVRTKSRNHKTKQKNMEQKFLKKNSQVFFFFFFFQWQETFVKATIYCFDLGIILFCIYIFLIWTSVLHFWEC